MLLLATEFIIHLSVQLLMQKPTCQYLCFDNAVLLCTEEMLFTLCFPLLCEVLLPDIQLTSRNKLHENSFKHNPCHHLVNVRLKYFEFSSSTWSLMPISPSFVLNMRPIASWITKTSSFPHIESSNYREYRGLSSSLWINHFKNGQDST